jgi:hypothetical protein
MAIWGPGSFEDWFWARHSNPKSGWSRIPAGPILALALYRRDWGLLLATLVWAALNPVLFSPPENEEAWMTRAVLAERWWIREEGNGTIGATYPNVLNAGSALAAVGTLYAAWRRRPVGTGVFVVLTVGLKSWWLVELVRHYDAREV